MGVGVDMLLKELTPLASMLPEGVIETIEGIQVGRSIDQHTPSHHNRLTPLASMLPEGVIETIEGIQVGRSINQYTLSMR